MNKFIKYENIRNQGFTHEENMFVLEIKTNINENQTKLKNFFDFPRSKFSKYERAIDSFKGKLIN